MPESPQLPAVANGDAPVGPQLPNPGDILGVYEITGPIGEGGMGHVYEGRHLSLGRRVAIKILRPEFVQRADMIERFFAEARVVNEINHANIVEILDFVREPGRVYCVMERLDGIGLNELIRQGPLPLTRVLAIAREIAAALCAAHRLGVVHRDLKPDNVFLARRQGVPDFVKVLDFGVAKLAGSVEHWHRARTLVGTSIGTPDHAAPEQLLGFSDVNDRADVYSFGVILFEMLAGHLPFDDEDLSRLAMRVMREPAPPVGARSAAGEVISDSLRRLVAACLEKEPGLRPSMEEVLAQLEHGAGPLGRGTGRRSRRTLVVAAGLFTAAASAGVSVWLRAGQAPKRANAAVAAPAPAKPTPPLPAAVSLEIVSNPPGATVRRADDGEILGTTPLRRTLPRSGTVVPLGLSLAGYQDASLSVQLDRDVRVDATLVAALPPHPHDAAPRKARHRASQSPDDTIDPF